MFNPIYDISFNFLFSTMNNIKSGWHVSFEMNETQNLLIVMHVLWLQYRECECECVYLHTFTHMCVCERDTNSP